MADDLFAKELAVVDRARRALAAHGPADDAAMPREELELVVKGYEKLIRQSKKLMRISDRNEAELGNVAKALDEKNAVLEALSLQLSKYLSPQIYNSIFSGQRDAVINTERKKLTVFFSDIKDFTTTTEDMQPEDLTALVNHYLTEMSEIALCYGATIDKYIGDAMLLFFGDPDTKGVQEDAVLCVLMALEMQERMRDLAEDWRNLGYERPFQMRIGINTGYCNVGNFGSDVRMDYTIIGGEVNLAARLETVTEAGNITLSHETYALVKHILRVKELSPITVKGIRREVRPYTVLGRRKGVNPAQNIIRGQTEGFRLFADLDSLKGKKRAMVIAEMKAAIKKLET